MFTVGVFICSTDQAGYRLLIVKEKTGMDAISELGITNDAIINKPSRVRKVSVDYQGNLKELDMNGNNSLRRRMSNSHNAVQASQIQSILIDAISKSRKSASSDARASGAWENAFIDQIQSLIESVKVSDSDSLVDCIKEEILSNDNQVPQTTSRTRRNSCFAVNRSVSYKNAVVGGRRMSVTERGTLQNQPGPRRKISTAGLENLNHLQTHEGFNPSVTQQPTGGRRNSVVTMQGRRSSVVTGNGRRNSVVTAGRRVSVAHLPSGLGGRRMSMTHNTWDNQNTHGPQRRSSVVKPACFNVSKISGLQRRLHKIYRQRRRKQRAHVDIADVRTAMGVEVNDKCDGKSSECESDNSVNNSNSDSENINVDQDDSCEISNLENSINNTLDQSQCSFNGSESDISSLDVTNDNIDSSVSNIPKDDSEQYTDQGPIPNPRRKTSIQVRSWEISRQLRQRRRQKRKSGKESDLI